jgi:hypothetical protein
MMKNHPLYALSISYFIYFGLFLCSPFSGFAQANYDESAVPNYVLPPLFDDMEVRDWETQHRSAWLNMIEKEMYGHFPDEGIATHFSIKNEDAQALDGRAVLKEVDMVFRKDNREVKASLLLILPKHASQKPTPLFLGLNFNGNHTIHHNTQISISKNWVRNNADLQVDNHKANEASRGKSSSRWPVDLILERGYGLATIYCGDLDPDFDDQFANGVHALIPEADKSSLSTISAWAWGLSRAMDYFEQDKDIDQTKISVIGHSRLGKTSLWAGASDTRFAMVISNDSGCGGAALSRRKFGETVKVINDRFPHWFNDRFTFYNDNEAKLPFDQHTLLAIIAPRPLCVASASEDQWADPKGEFLSAKAACPAYQIYGIKSCLTKMPAMGNPVIAGKISYHLRNGKHDITKYDWEQYLNMADRFLK